MSLQLVLNPEFGKHTTAVNFQACSALTDPGVPTWAITAVPLLIPTEDLDLLLSNISEMVAGSTSQRDSEFTVRATYSGSVRFLRVNDGTVVDKALKFLNDCVGGFFKLTWVHGTVSPYIETVTIYGHLRDVNTGFSGPGAQRGSFTFGPANFGQANYVDVARA